MRLIGSLSVLLLSALLSPGALLTGQDRRPLAIEDFYRLKTPGAVQISPDGRWVAFTVTTRLEDDPAAKRENESITETYVVASDAAEGPGLILHEGKNVSNPRWSDDNWLLYSLDRQQWKVDPSGKGGRVFVRTLQAGGRGRGNAEPIASPDGKWILETQEKEQARPAPSYASEFEKRHYERFKGVTFDWKDFQRDGEKFPLPDPTAANALQIVIRPAGGGPPNVLVDMDLRPSNLVWHPDGRTIAFTADREWRNELKYASPDLWTVTVDGKVAPLTNDGYAYGDLAYSPDGKYLAFTRTFGTDMVIDQKLNHGGPRDLFIVPTGGGEPINLTTDWDLEPEDARWSSDSRHLYFTATTGGEVHLFRVDLGTHGPTDQGTHGPTAPRTHGPRDPRTQGPKDPRTQQVTRGPRRLNNVTFNKAVTKIAYTVGVHDAPPDVYSANIDGTGERRLTDINKPVVDAVAFSRAERLSWKSRDGTPIEGWLMFPHRYPSTRFARSGQALLYPMIVTSHGGPHSATGYAFNFKNQYFAANGYFVLDTNFRSSTGYGEKFKWATWGAWGDKDGEDVISGVDHVLKNYPIDPSRIGHIGHSYGGFMTNWLITQYPGRFAAAVSGAGISNWISDYGTADIYRTKETEFFGTPWQKEARERMIRQSPLTYADRVRTPTLFVHGEVDQRVPYEEAEQMYFALKRRGVPAKMIQYAGQPHSIGGHNNMVHRILSELAWFDKYLKPRAKTSSAAGR